MKLPAMLLHDLLAPKWAHPVKRFLACVESDKMSELAAVCNTCQWGVFSCANAHEVCRMPHRQPDKHNHDGTRNNRTMYICCSETPLTLLPLDDLFSQPLNPIWFPLGFPLLSLALR